MKYKCITILFAPFLMASANIIAQPHKSVDIRAERLEKEEHSVFLDYEIYVDKNHLSDCESVFVYPFLKKGERVIDFEPVAINGKLRRNSYKRWMRLHGDNGGTDSPKHVYTAGDPGTNPLFFSKSFPYEEWMNGSVLYARQIVWGCGEELSETTIELARLLVPEPVTVPQPEPVRAPQPPVAPLILQKEGVAFINFPVGKSEINPEFRSNSEELSKIGELISEINRDPNAKITGLAITGYASPEGSYEVNDRLSRERARNLSRHINLYYRLNLPASSIEINNVAEDWEGLVRKVEEDRPLRHEEILTIIGTVHSLDKREQLLMRLDGGSAWRILKEQFFPRLRRTEYKIFYQTNE